MKETIDVVYTWVDMDENFIEKYNKYVDNDIIINRYRQNDELKYSLMSLKYLDFIRNIFIVTDNQTPNKELIKDSRIKIIDHKQIIPEKYLPTFKSTTIESFLHKIPGLSENFLYFNDDCFIGKKIKYSKFFNKKPIVYLTICDYMDKDPVFYEEQPWEYANLNAFKLMEDKLKVKYNWTYIHQVTLMNKKSCDVTWDFFGPELDKSCQFKTRIPMDVTVNFVLLSQFVGEYIGKLILRNVEKSLVTLCGDCVSDIHTDNYKNDLYRLKPHLFCINTIEPSQKVHFNIFMRNYLK
jgi:hypothetical protein